MKLSDLSKATEDRLGKVEKATLTETENGVLGVYPDALSISDTYVKQSNNLSDIISSSIAFNNIKQPATETSTGVIEKATTQEAIDAVVGKYPDAAGVKAHVDSVVVAHKDEVDPHTQYETKVEVDKRLLRESLLKEATLNLDFANNRYEVYEGPVDNLTAKPFNDIVTFTRASAASARNAIGGLSPVLTDQQRLVGNREGLLIEEQRTNLLLWSEAFDNAVWEVRQTDVVANPSDLAPDGTSTTEFVREDSTDNAHSTFQNIALVADNTYTQSYYVAPRAVKWARIRGQGGPLASGPEAYFDLINNIVGTTNGSQFVDAGIEEAGNGFKRIWLTATVNSTGGLASFALYLAKSDGVSTYLGNGSNGFLVWGAQIEAGSFPTSYIKTEGSQVTRSSDNASVDDLSGWFNRDGFTVYVECGLNSPDWSPDFSKIYSFAYLSDGTSNNGYFFRQANNKFELLKRVGGANAETALLSSVNAPIRTKIAYSVDGSGLVLAANGVANSVAGTTGQLSLNQLEIGSQGGVQIFNGAFGSVKAIPRALSATELQALTS